MRGDESDNVVSTIQESKSKGKNADRCDICDKRDGYQDFNLQKCRTCGVCVHEQCYGLKNSHINRKYPSWQCHACEFVGKEVKVTFPNQKLKVIKATSRPTECALCCVKKGNHAMHPLYDVDGKQGKPLILKADRYKGLPERTAWVHTLCACFLATKGFCWGCDKNGKHENAKVGEMSKKREFAVSRPDSPSYSFSGNSDISDDSSDDGDAGGVLKASPHHFVIANKLDSNEGAFQKMKKFREQCKCCVCNNKDSLPWCRRIAVQCCAGDSDEFEELKGCHKNMPYACSVSMHVGCARWRCSDEKRVYYFPGVADSSRRYTEPVASIYCAKHSRDIKNSKSKGKVKKQIKKVGTESLQKNDKKTTKSNSSQHTNPAKYDNGLRKKKLLLQDGKLADSPNSFQNIETISSSQYGVKQTRDPPSKIRHSLSSNMINGQHGETGQTQQSVISKHDSTSEQILDKNNKKCPPMASSFLIPRKNPSTTSLPKKIKKEYACDSESSQKSSLAVLSSKKSSSVLWTQENSSSANESGNQEQPINLYDDNIAGKIDHSDGDTSPESIITEDSTFKDRSYAACQVKKNAEKEKLLPPTQVSPRSSFSEVSASSSERRFYSETESDISLKNVKHRKGRCHNYSTEWGSGISNRLITSKENTVMQNAQNSTKTSCKTNTEYNANLEYTCGEKSNTSYQKYITERNITGSNTSKNGLALTKIEWSSNVNENNNEKSTSTTTLPDYIHSSTSTKDQMKSKWIRREDYGNSKDNSEASNDLICRNEPENVQQNNRIFAAGFDGGTSKECASHVNYKNKSKGNTHSAGTCDGKVDIDTITQSPHSPPSPTSISRNKRFCIDKDRPKFQQEEREKRMRCDTKSANCEKAELKSQIGASSITSDDYGSTNDTFEPEIGSGKEDIFTKKRRISSMISNSRCMDSDISEVVRSHGIVLIPGQGDPHRSIHTPWPARVVSARESDMYRRLYKKGRIDIDPEKVCVVFYFPCWRSMNNEFLMHLNASTVKDGWWRQDFVDPSKIYPFIDKEVDLHGLAVDVVDRFRKGWTIAAGLKQWACKTNLQKPRLRFKCKESGNEIHHNVLEYGGVLKIHDEEWLKAGNSLDPCQIEEMIRFQLMDSVSSDKSLANSQIVCTMEKSTSTSAEEECNTQANQKGSNVNSRKDHNLFHVIDESTGSGKLTNGGNVLNPAVKQEKTSDAPYAMLYHGLGTQLLEKSPSSELTSLFQEMEKLPNKLEVTDTDQGALLKLVSKMGAKLIGLELEKQKLRKQLDEKNK